jgi:hypothetical protein
VWVNLYPGPGEPLAGPWRSITVSAFLSEILGSGADGGSDRLVLAVDGRSGAGKTTLARRLQASTHSTYLVSTDDIAWHAPMFAWATLAAAGVLALFRAGHRVHYRPPAWDTHARPGHIDVPEDISILLLEGVGPAQRGLIDLIDVAIWVQSDFHIAERLGIARDIASGVNGDETEFTAFWHAWMAAEIPFLEQDRPWERVDAIVAGASGELNNPQLVKVAPPLAPR